MCSIRHCYFLKKVPNSLHTTTGCAYAQQTIVYRVRDVQQEASQAERRTLPTWLDGQTVAIIGTVLTVGAMNLASISALRAEMNDLRTELTERIEDVRTELTARIEDVRKELTVKIEDVRKELTVKIEDVRKELGAQIAGLDARLRVVEQSMEASRVGVPDLQARVRELEAHARQPADAAHPPSIDAGKG